MYKKYIILYSNTKKILERVKSNKSKNEHKVEKRNKNYCVIIALITCCFIHLYSYSKRMKKKILKEHMHSGAVRA